MEPTATSNSAVPVALRWRLTQPTPHNLQINLSLLDEAEVPLAAADGLLLDKEGRPSSLWPVGTEVTTYHLLPVYAGTAPLAYQVALSLFYVDDAGVQTVSLWETGQQRMVVGGVQLERPSPLAPSFYDQPPALPPPENPVSYGGLQLAGMSIDHREAAPGDSVFVWLNWQAAAELADVRPDLLLKQNGDVLTAVPSTVFPQYPTSLWQVGETVMEYRHVQIPAQIEAGTAAFWLVAGNAEFPVGSIEVSGASRNFTPPVDATLMDVSFGSLARLAGFEIEQTILPAGEPFTLTLYWQALQTGAPDSYKVFIHLVSEDGRIIAQHDGFPASGGRLTTGWLLDEYISDSHELTFNEPDYEGKARLRVGLYEPNTGERLLTSAGEDAVLLPVELMVEGE